MKNIKKYFITGLVIVVPVVLTVYVLVSLFLFADGILGRYINIFFKRNWGFYIPGLGFLVFALIIFLVGLVTNQILGQRFFPSLQKWFAGLPLVRIIYPAFHQVIRFMLGQKGLNFKKVVLIEYPSKGLWSIGFLTNEKFDAIDKACANEMISVFVPNTPGPLAGYVVFVRKEEIKVLDMSVSEALKIIISGGVFKGGE